MWNVLRLDSALLCVNCVELCSAISRRQRLRAVFGLLNVRAPFFARRKAAVIY